MSADRQVPNPSVAQIAASLDRIGMRRPPGSGVPHGADGPHGAGGLHGRGGPHARGSAERHGAHGHHDDPERGDHGFSHGGPHRQGDDAGPLRRRGAMGARRMLHAIVHAERPSSITDLGRAIGVDQPRASRLVQALADAGLVRRIPDPSDGRRVVIEPTKAGRSRFEAHAEARAAEVAAAAESLTEAELAELARLLAKLAAAWPA